MIVAVVGQTLLLAAFVACICAVVSGVIAGRRGAERGASALHVAQTSIRTVAGCAVGAIMLLFGALVTSNFQLAYVAEHTNKALPLFYKFASLWSGQQGSLLLWLTMLSCLSVLFLAKAPRTLDPATRGYAAATLGTAAGFFAMMVAFVARPFAESPQVVVDGAGMSASLQNYWMAIHPIALYTGYVSCTIPFAIVVGALLARRKDDLWVRSTRQWSLLAWTGLTLGLGLGARWAYEEIGWGGFWAWDPVENAALMPWLAMTAFLHSIMVQERRGMMRFWNMALVSATFSLSIFGTFLTRSGILSSVHSFVESSIGWWFIAYVMVIVIASCALLFARREFLRARHDLDAVVSRETSFLFNNLLLASLATMVLWGVVYPIGRGALGGDQIAMQPPYYDFFLALFGVPLLLMMGLGPLIGWRGSHIRDVARRALWPCAGGLIAGILLLLATDHVTWVSLSAVSFAGFVLGSVVHEFYRGIQARRRSVPVSRTRAFGQLFARNRRRYGGYVAHAGVGLLVIGIVGSTMYTNVREVTLHRGQRMTIGAYQLRYNGMQRTRNANAMSVRANFSVRWHDRSWGTLASGKNFYPVSQETVNHVGIRSNVLTGEDLYVIVNKLGDDGVAQLKVLINPLVNLLWLAILVIACGGALAGVPLTRRKRGSRPRHGPPIEHVTPPGEAGELGETARDAEQRDIIPV